MGLSGVSLDIYSTDLSSHGDFAQRIASLPNGKFITSAARDGSILADIEEKALNYNKMVKAYERRFNMTQSPP